MCEEHVSFLLSDETLLELSAGYKYHENCHVHHRYTPHFELEYASDLYSFHFTYFQKSGSPYINHGLKFDPEKEKVHKTFTKDKGDLPL